MRFCVIRLIEANALGSNFIIRLTDFFRLYKEKHRSARVFVGFKEVFCFTLVGEVMGENGKQFPKSNYMRH